MDTILRGIQNPEYSKYLAPLIWLGDAALSYLIVLRVPYTEIDWTAYMEQVLQIVDGERDYLLIQGGTGPLVYPAGHVAIFNFLYNWTNSGLDIRTAQLYFVGLYLLTLAIVLTIYVKAKIPPYILPLLVLSKRIHSIYVLRMFNDCFTTLGAVTAILVLQSTRLGPLLRSTIAAVIFSLAISVKMSGLLYLPGAAIIFLYNLKSVWACVAALGVPFFAPQIILAIPFIRNFPESYVQRAFEFSRVFMFKWTVNWRFVGEEIFLSKPFALGLLAAQLLILIAFIATPRKRFLKGFAESSLVEFIKNAFTSGVVPRVVDNYPRYVVETIALSNLIGVLCARSLHYQFYCWFYWSVPLLLYTCEMPWYLIYPTWFLQEYAWNVYPSTTASSLVVVISLLTIVYRSWAKELKCGEKNTDNEKKIK